MAANAIKISCSLPRRIVADLDVIAAAFRVTRSALLTQLLDEAVDGLRQICGQHILPLDDSSGNKKQTERAIVETLDRLAIQIEQARGSYAKSTKH